jgi:hypothetical protein
MRPRCGTWFDFDLYLDCGTTYMDEMRIRANLKEVTSLSDEEVERLQLPCQSE